MKEEVKKPTLWELWTEEMFPLDVYDKGEFFLTPLITEPSCPEGMKYAVSCTGNWGMTLRELYAKYTRDWSPPPAGLDLAVFERVFASASILRRDGYTIVYSLGKAPEVELMRNVVHHPYRNRGTTQVRELNFVRTICEEL